MKKIGITGIYYTGAMETLLNNVPEGFEAVVINDSTQYHKLKDVEYIINRLQVDSEIFKLSPNLKLVQKWGAGFDDVDLKLSGEMGIPITNCPGINSTPVAELAIMLMLSVYRNLLPINKKIKNGIWPKSEYFGRSYTINQKLVGIIGLGNIGKKVAKLVTSFGAKVQYYDIVRQENQEKEFGYEFVDIHELLKTSDIVSLHVPLNELTKDMINKYELSLMKPTSIIINTARGPIINEEALIEVLQNQSILGAGVDNFPKEPIPKDHPLLQFEYVVATSHAGGNTKDNDINMVNYCYSNIVKFDQGLPFNSERDLINGVYLK